MATSATYARIVTSLRLRPRMPGRVLPALLAPVVVTVVLGILGMHGVGAHGVTINGAMADADAATSSASVMPGHHQVSDEREQDVLTALAGTRADAHAGHGTSAMSGMSGMVMLCVAMLASAAALLVLLVRRGRLPRMWAVLQPAGRVWRPESRTLRLGVGPPSVWRFSIIRC